MSSRARPAGEPRKPRTSPTDVALDVDVTRTADHDLVTVTGELDLLTAGRLGEALSDPALCSRRRLVVDLTGLRLLSASGVRTLLVARASREAQGGTLVLVCGHRSSMTLRILEVTGLLDVFEVADSIAGVTAPRPNE